jgi:hypothetical protein
VKDDDQRSGGFDQSTPFQMRQIIAQRTVSRTGIDLSTDFGNLAISPTGTGVKNLALAFSEIVRHAIFSNSR